MSFKSVMEFVTSFDLTSEMIFFPLFSRGLLSSSVCLWTRQKWLQCGSPQKCAADTWRGSATVVHPCFHKVSENCSIGFDLFIFSLLLLLPLWCIFKCITF